MRPSGPKEDADGGAADRPVGIARATGGVPPTGIARGTTVSSWSAVSTRGGFDRSLPGRSPDPMLIGVGEGAWYAETTLGADAFASKRDVDRLPLELLYELRVGVALGAGLE